MIDTMRAENEDKMKRGFEKTTKDLKKELAETKTVLTQVFKAIANSQKLSNCFPHKLLTHSYCCAAS